MSHIKEILQETCGDNKKAELELFSQLQVIRDDTQESKTNLNKLIFKHEQEIDIKTYDKFKIAEKPLVYISYTSAQKEFVAKLYKDISNYFKCYAFLESGFYTINHNSLHDASVFICCLTDEYYNTVLNMEELKIAFKKDKYIIPVLLTDCWPVKKIKDYLIANIYVDFTTPQQIESNFPKLNRLLQNVFL